MSEFEIEVRSRHIEALEQERDQAREQLAELEETCASWRCAAEDWDSTEKQLKEQLAAAERERDMWRAKFGENGVLAQNLESELNAVKDAREFQADMLLGSLKREQKESAMWESHATKLKERLAAAERERDEVKQCALNISEENVRFRAELAMLRRDSARPAYSESELVQKLTADIEYYKRKLDQESEALCNAIRNAIRNNQKLTAERDAAIGRAAELEDKLDGTDTELAACCERNITLQRQLAEITAERDHFKAVAEGAYEGAQDGAAYLRRKLDTLKRQLAEIREAWGAHRAHQTDRTWEELDRTIRGNEGKET